MRLHPLPFWKGRGLGNGLRTLPQGRDRWGKYSTVGRFPPSLLRFLSPHTNRGTEGGVKTIEESLGERWSPLWKEGRGDSKKLRYNIPIIPPRIPTHFPYLSVIQFMNTHMVNQIRPLLLMESTPQGITQENTVITILTRHPSLNHRKLTERQTRNK